MPTQAATCPFCGLLCDDLDVARRADAIHVTRGACSIATAAFASLGTPTVAACKPRVRGVQCDLNHAIDVAAQVLGRARRPVIGGLATDVAGMRATLGLARRLGAVVDHAGSAAKYRNLHVLQEAGWITTTLAEVKNRADTVVLLGEGWHRRFPRFVERVLRAQNDLFERALPRRIVLVNQVSTDAIESLESLDRDASLTTLDAPVGALPVLLGMLSAMATNQPVDPTRALGIDTARLSSVLDALRAARYGVVVWAAADLDFPHAELALHALARLIRTLNQTTRFAALPLAGTDGDLTANAVQTWQSGVPYPASYANGTIDFDPHRHSAARIIEASKLDALLWIASLGVLEAPPTEHVPTVVLGRADATPQHEPEVFIPVATPGIDAAGHLLRTDKVITLHLARLRESGLPAVATVVEAIQRRLTGAAC